jgi:hypothetical protein
MHSVAAAMREVDVAQDWSLMISIGELARRPVWLYLHERSGAGKGSGAAHRNGVIRRLMEKTSLRHQTWKAA